MIVVRTILSRIKEKKKKKKQVVSQLVFRQIACFLFFFFAILLVRSSRSGEQDKKIAELEEKVANFKQEKKKLEEALQASVTKANVSLRLCFVGFFFFFGTQWRDRSVFWFCSGNLLRIINPILDLFALRQISSFPPFFLCVCVCVFVCLFVCVCARARMCTFCAAGSA